MATPPPLTPEQRAAALAKAAESVALIRELNHLRQLRNPLEAWVQGETPAMRKIVYDLRFNRGFKIKLVTMDGFESTEMRQQFNKKKIAIDYLSMDRSMLPYQDFFDAIMD